MDRPSPCRGIPVPVARPPVPTQEVTAQETKTPPARPLRGHLLCAGTALPAAGSARAPRSARLSSSSSSKVGSDSKDLGAGAMAEGARAALQRVAVSGAAPLAKPPNLSTGDAPATPTHSPPPTAQPYSRVPRAQVRLAQSHPGLGPADTTPPFPRFTEPRTSSAGDSGRRTATRTRAHAPKPTPPGAPPDVVVIETPRPRAPGSGCLPSARGSAAHPRRGAAEDTEDPLGVPAATSLLWLRARQSLASTCPGPACSARSSLLPGRWLFTVTVQFPAAADFDLGSLQGLFVWETNSGSQARAGGEPRAQAEGVCCPECPY